MDAIKLRIRITVLGIFLIGFAGGLFAARLYYAPKVAAVATAKPKTDEEEKRDLIKQYNDKLNMTVEQQDKMSQILDETREQFKQFHRDMQPRMDDIRNNARARIRATLTAEQQPKFDEFVRERDAQRQKSKSK